MSRPYTDDPVLAPYDLGESVVLACEPRADGFRLRVAFALTRDHPLYRPPRRGERLARQTGELRFERVNRVAFTPGDGSTPGTVDRCRVEDDGWSLAGAWGTLRVHGGEVDVALFPDAVGQRQRR